MKIKLWHILIKILSLRNIQLTGNSFETSISFHAYRICLHMASIKWISETCWIKHKLNYYVYQFVCLKNILKWFLLRRNDIIKIDYWKFIFLELWFWWHASVFTRGSESNCLEIVIGNHLFSCYHKNSSHS